MPLIDLPSLKPLFEPRSIAVYGASGDPGKIGGRPLRYLKEFGFGGDIYPVNPARDFVQGLKAYPTAAAITGDLDLAVIVVPTGNVLPALRDCLEKTIGGAVVMSSGFSEAGPAGEALQNEIAELAAVSGVRILGPNCLGLANPNISASVTFSPARELRWPEVGTIGFATQSGAFGSHCAAVCAERGIGLGTWITTGNEVDVDIADAIAYLAADAHTTVVAGYIEGCRNAEKLSEALFLARDNGKPVILLKAGTTPVGAAAVASHTAVLAGRDELYDAFFRQHGVLRVGSVGELLDAAYAAAPGILPRSGRTAIVSTSGGVGVLMGDTAIEAGLAVEELPAPVQDEIKAVLPLAATRNPIDTTAQIVNDIEIFSKSLRIVIDGGEVDIVVAHISFIGYDTALMARIAEPLRELRERYPETLFALSMLSSGQTRRQFEELGYLVYDDPTRAVRAAAACRHLAAGRDRAGRRPIRTEGRTPLLDRPLALEHEAKAWLGSAGIAVPEERIATSADDAAVAAERIGFPVVMKVLSPDIAHKTEAGGIALNVADGAAAARTFDDILQRVRTARPDARIAGVLVARQVEGGTETIAGIVDDPALGAFVMFGLGGIFAETMKDVVFRRVPFDRDEALAMVGELRGADILRGARGRPAADLESLAEVLERLSRIAEANRGRIESLDINPLIARADGAFACDALIATREA